MPRKGQREKNPTTLMKPKTKVEPKNDVKDQPKFLCLSEYRRSKCVLTEQDTKNMSFMASDTEKQAYMKQRSQTSRYIVIAYTLFNKKIRYGASIYRFNYLDTVDQFRQIQPETGKGAIRKAFKEFEKKKFESHKATALERFYKNPIITSFELPASLIPVKKDLEAKQTQTTEKEKKETPKDTAPATTTINDWSSTTKKKTDATTHHVCHACHQEVSIEQMRKVRSLKRSVREASATKFGTLHHFMTHKLRNCLGKYGTNSKSPQWVQYCEEVRVK
jgi:hypothetical protein